jgi:hypothetical protein
MPNPPGLTEVWGLEVAGSGSQRNTVSVAVGQATVVAEPSPEGEA